MRILKTAALAASAARAGRAFSLAPLALALLAGFASNASAGFVTYTIRGTPVINPDTPAPGQTEVIISAAGQKAALGSSDVDGNKLGELTMIHIDRIDDRTRFTPGSGPYVGPYLNFWITDGAGRYAVIANEPSNPDFQPLYDNGYALAFSDLSDKVAKVFETNDKSWLPNLGVGLKFSDLANFIIQAPTVAELTVGWAGLGSGAPRELGTNAAYGVNWVFGDTLSNYVSGDRGYVVANASVVAAAVPEPVSLALVGIALAGAFVARRRTR